MLGLPSGAAPGGILINNPPLARRSMAKKYTGQVHVFCDPLLKAWACPKGQVEARHSAAAPASLLFLRCIYPSGVAASRKCHVANQGKTLTKE